MKINPDSAVSSAPVAGVGAWTQALLRATARSAPAELAPRLTEEWLAAAAELPRGLAQLRFALGCCWAARVIAWEQAPAEIAAASGGHTAALSGSDDGYFSRRSVILLTIIGVHGLVIYAFVTGLAQDAVSKWLPADISGTLIPAVTHHPIPPPPPLWSGDPRTLPQPPSLPSLGAIDDSEHTLTATGRVEPPAPLPPMVQRQQGGPGTDFPNADAFYPSSARRLNEQGAVGVQVCVNANGQLDGTPSVIQSSGSERLDQGAVRLALAGSGHYRSSLQNGRAIDSCFAFRVRFRLH